MWLPVNAAELESEDSTFRQQSVEYLLHEYQLIERSNARRVGRKGGRLQTELVQVEAPPPKTASARTILFEFMIGLGAWIE